MHPLANFEIRRYQSEPRFNGLYWNHLPKAKNEAYAINLREYKSVETHWIALYIIGGNVIYFDSFGFKYISKET